MLSVNGSSFVCFKVALVLPLVALCKPTAGAFIESFPFLPLLITLPTSTAFAGCCSFKVEVSAFIVEQTQHGSRFGRLHREGGRLLSAGVTARRASGFGCNLATIDHQEVAAKRIPRPGSGNLEAVDTSSGFRSGRPYRPYRRSCDSQEFQAGILLIYGNNAAQAAHVILLFVSREEEAPIKRIFSS